MIGNFYLATTRSTAQVGGYLADVLDGDENNFIKSVLNVINPKVIILVILNANIDHFVGWD